MFIKVNFLILFFFISQLLFGFYPEVTSNNGDVLYKQITADIKENNKRLHLQKKTIPVQFYTYSPNKTENLFTISSRFNLTYETIASLNNIDNQLFFKDMEKILLPTCQGIYSKIRLDGEESEIISVKGQELYFYPGKKFTMGERLNFLVTPFKSPLMNMKVTSEFGNRENPFTGRTEFHSGLDIRADEGTKIYSPYRGVINNIGYSDFYGNFLIIKHTNGYSTHYYHLNRIITKVGNNVEKGDFIALSGNSGKSTGPHLHFEIQLNGEPINPRILLGDV